MRFLFVVSAFFYIYRQIDGRTEQEAAVKKEIFKNYSSKVRPVKSKDDKPVQVTLFFFIEHIEAVDENQQTISLHGRISASWKDAYLTWKPKDYGDTYSIMVRPYRIWKPDLALYNSATGSREWSLNAYASDANVIFTGSVRLEIPASLVVTCLFDFSDYPYDEQHCEIAIGDWIYDLSHVNLTFPYHADWGKPIMSLSYSPKYWTKSGILPDQKRHVAGWEVTNTSRTDCYWGYKGCQSTYPEMNPMYYWSVVKFGLTLKRHAPYFGLVAILPTLMTSGITLAAFWIDTDSMVLIVLTANLVLQGVFGFDLIKMLPPGSGTMPKIMSMFAFNFAMTGIAFLLHLIVDYLLSVFPPDQQLPFRLSEWTEKLSRSAPFQLPGLQFDPQRLMDENDDEYRDEILGALSGPSRPAPPTAFMRENNENLMTPVSDDSTETSTNQEQLIDTTEPKGGNGDEKSSTTSTPTLRETAETFRRALFFLYLLMYIITILICIVF